MLLSKSCRYALRAVMYIAAQKEEEKPFYSISSISDQLHIPFHFLTKVLQQLTSDGILISTRGPSGGVALAKPAAEVTVADVVTSIEGPALFFSCVLGLEGCGSREPCPLHEHWAEEREKIRSDFQSTTFAMLAKDINTNMLRLMDPEDPDANYDPDKMAGKRGRKPNRRVPEATGD